MGSRQTIDNPQAFPQGLKPWFIWGILGTTKEAAEKGLISSEIPEKHSSGAEARIDFACVIPGINPRPTARMSFSAACKVVPFQNEPFAISKSGSPWAPALLLHAALVGDVEAHRESPGTADRARHRAKVGGVVGAILLVRIFGVHNGQGCQSAS